MFVSFLVFFRLLGLPDLHHRPIIQFDLVSSLVRSSIVESFRFPFLSMMSIVLWMFVDLLPVSSNLCRHEINSANLLHQYHHHCPDTRMSLLRWPMGDNKGSSLSQIAERDVFVRLGIESFTNLWKIILMEVILVLVRCLPILSLVLLTRMFNDEKILCRHWRSPCLSLV